MICPGPRSNQCEALAASCQPLLLENTLTLRRSLLWLPDACCGVKAPFQHPRRSDFPCGLDDSHGSAHAPRRPRARGEGGGNEWG